MLRRRLYYAVKPYVPWRVRMTLRRLLARQKRRRFHEQWPISESAGRTPDAWTGWPDAKQFALVLTHDVEGPEGLAGVRALAEAEMALGFRSSFNFIPEGPYSVSPELRQWLIGHGFEVGVHDLKHDGKLYHSRSEFHKSSDRINRYVHEWGAKGFRSGFMLRNLEWIHRLDVAYDSSTFDTDPFEPQSNGADTIFPYWIPRPAPVASGKDVSNEVQPLAAISGIAVGVPAGGPSKEGYVELPYTLPQDSTLFLVLEEKSPAIWLKKVDWVVAKGGMVLVNVHPDYIQFPGQPTHPTKYPLSHYLELLRHLNSRHAGQFWPALPRDVAQFVRGLNCPPLNRPAKRVGMITHSFYETDNRVTRYAEALAERGDHVEVIALRRSPRSPAREQLSGVTLDRIQYRKKKSEQTSFALFWPMLRFLVSSSWLLSRRHARQRYDVLHIHNMPDFLVFAAWFPKVTGTKLILDIHDIVPELYASKFGGGKRPVTMALLKLMERASAAFANHVIVSNHLWLDLYTTRTRTVARSSVFINNVDTRLYRPNRTRGDDGRLVILFPGGLQWHQGLDIALDAFARIKDQVPNAVFQIYGDGNMKPSLIAQATSLGLNGQVQFFDPVPVHEIVKIMANADLGVVPKRADSFGNEAYSTKIMEFMSLGVPVVVSKTKIDAYYFDDSVVRFFESGNVAALAEAMLEVLRNSARRQQMITSALGYAEKHGWNSRKADYLNLVDSLSPQSNEN